MTGGMTVKVTNKSPAGTLARYAKRLARGCVLGTKAVADWAVPEMKKIVPHETGALESSIHHYDNGMEGFAFVAIVAAGEKGYVLNDREPYNYAGAVHWGISKHGTPMQFQNGRENRYMEKTLSRHDEIRRIYITFVTAEVGRG